MCLAIPVQIEAIADGRATVTLGGMRTQVQVSLVPEARVGDWALVHAGVAITVLEEKEARETYELLAAVASTMEEGEL